MRAKVVHDDINAGGGSERLAIVTMSLLAEMGFKVDLASFNKPDIGELKKDFGDVVDSIDINPVSLDLFSMLDIDGSNSQDDGDYDLVVNTHGDLLPYYSQKDASRIVTYCHFPIVPQLARQDNNGHQGYMRFLRRWVDVDGIEQGLLEKILERVPKAYDSMMGNTTVVTNSNFSKRAIQQQYGPSVRPTVVYPPVDVNKFSQIALQPQDRENTILVLSRFSSDKRLENTIEIGNILINEIKINAKFVLVGNIAPEDSQYLEELKRLIGRYSLEDNFTIQVDASFDRLLELMQKSKVYLHPLAGEPFGISVVEAMSAGLIPVVPDQGGYTEFVPEYYQFHTHRQAADVMGKILIASDNDMQAERSQLSESVSKFSADSYKAGFRKVIEPILPSKSSGSVAA